MPLRCTRTSLVCRGGCGLIKTGGGMLELSSENTFGGGIALSQGTLVLASDGAAGAGSIAISNNSTLEGSGDRTLSNPIVLDGPASVYVRANQTLQLGGTLTNS